ncbi:MAG: hypothetical protein ACK5JT_07610, partial [Hyphomicrobiaceae bacterium]
KMGQDMAYWHLAVGSGSPDNLDVAAANDLARTGFNMADPFLFTHQDRLFVFYESFTAGGHSATISAGVIEHGKMRPLGEVLRCPYHLSYPHIFAHDGEIYLMPETQQANRLEIWRAVNFPHHWELHATAFEGEHLAESNLVELDGTWWLFTNLSDHHAFQDHRSALHLFRTSGPDLKSFSPHPRNPVVLGSRQARNAGPIVAANGHLYRPTQSHAYDTYGYGINICEIDRITSSDYQERVLRRIRPDFRNGMIGIHHISFANGYFAVDMHQERGPIWRRHRSSA